MKALFIGGTGIISAAVSKLAVQQGWELTLMNRGTSRQWVPEGASVIHADIRNPAEAKAALQDKTFDTVVDWVSFEPAHVQADLELFSGRVGQFMFISSASAYQKPVRYYLIDESTPLANPFSQYARNKIACEELLICEHREHSFPCTIIRPSFTYGFTMIPYAFNSWSKPYTLVNRIRTGKKVIVPGDGTSLWTITHNTDFAKGFLGLMGNQHALGHAFNIMSDEVLTWDQMLEAIAAAAGEKPNVVHIASDYICSKEPSMTAALLGDFSHSAVFCCGKLKRFVPGFAATVPFASGIRRTVEFFENHPEMLGVDEEYDSVVDRIIDSYLKL